MKKKIWTFVVLSMFVFTFMTNSVNAEDNNELICGAWKNIELVNDGEIWVNISADGSLSVDTWDAKGQTVIGVSGYYENTQNAYDFILQDENGNNIGAMQYDETQDVMNMSFYEEDYVLEKNDEDEYVNKDLLASTDIDFRGHDFGTSHDAVFASEIDSSMNFGEDYIDADSLLVVFSDKVGGYDASTTYMFDDKGLHMGMYVVEVTDKPYYDAYCDLVEKYKTKYGEPYEIRIHWYDEMYRNMPTEWENAVKNQDVMFTTYWLDENADIIVITLEATDESPDTPIAILYSSGAVGFENELDDMEGI